MYEKISDLWPPLKELNPEMKSIFKSPTFKHYTFHIAPPTDITDYSPIEISENLKCTDTAKTTSHLCCYTPALAPPLWPNGNQNNPAENNISPRRHVVERLTLGSSSKNTFPLYDFNGDFYLKFIALECYGNHLF